MYTIFGVIYNTHDIPYNTIYIYPESQGLGLRTPSSPPFQYHLVSEVFCHVQGLLEFEQCFKRCPRTIKIPFGLGNS